MSLCLLYSLQTFRIFLGVILVTEKPEILIADKSDNWDMELFLNILIGYNTCNKH